MAYAPTAIRIATPIGALVMTAADGVLTRLVIGDAHDAAAAATDDPLLAEASAQLDAYFDGRLTAFDLPLAPVASPRGAALRAAISALRQGETASYGALAAAARSAPRAVGQACARNPLPIIVPCHRVLGAGDRLGAYSAGAGPQTKRWLLSHEGANFRCP